MTAFWVPGAYVYFYLQYFKHTLQGFYFQQNIFTV